VDAVYDSDPKINSNAMKIDKITYMEILNRQLGVMDSTASTLCMDNNIPVIVFGIKKPDNIIKVLSGENIGTYIAREV
jgi:uridylate kinase